MIAESIRCGAYAILLVATLILAATSLADDTPSRAFCVVDSAGTADWSESVSIPAEGTFTVEIIHEGASNDTLGVVFGNDTTGSSIIWMDSSDPLLRIETAEFGRLRFKARSGSNAPYKVRAWW